METAVSLEGRNCQLRDCQVKRSHTVFRGLCQDGEGWKVLAKCKSCSAQKCGDRLATSIGGLVRSIQTSVGLQQLPAFYNGFVFSLCPWFAEQHTVGILY